MTHNPSIPCALGGIESACGRSGPVKRKSPNRHLNLTRSNGQVKGVPSLAPSKKSHYQALVTSIAKSAFDLTQRWLEDSLVSPWLAPSDVVQLRALLCTASDKLGKHYMFACLQALAVALDASDLDAMFALRNKFAQVVYIALEGQAFKGRSVSLESTAPNKALDKAIEKALRLRDKQSAALNKTKAPKRAKGKPSQGTRTKAPKGRVLWFGHTKQYEDALYVLVCNGWTDDQAIDLIASGVDCGLCLKRKQDVQEGGILLNTLANALVTAFRAKRERVKADNKAAKSKRVALGSTRQRQPRQEASQRHDFFFELALALEANEPNTVETSQRALDRVIAKQG